MAGHFALFLLIDDGIEGYPTKSTGVDGALQTFILLYGERRFCRVHMYDGAP